METVQSRPRLISADQVRIRCPIRVVRSSFVQRSRIVSENKKNIVLRRFIFLIDIVRGEEIDGISRVGGRGIPWKRKHCLIWACTCFCYPWDIDCIC